MRIYSRSGLILTMMMQLCQCGGFETPQEKTPIAPLQGRALDLKTYTDYRPNRRLRSESTSESQDWDNLVYKIRV